VVVVAAGWPLGAVVAAAFGSVGWEEAGGVVVDGAV
jgi:hypothetical protein